MKISHEVPKSMLSASLTFNDYDYALVHLLKDPIYRKFYETCIAQGREVILDNSLYELGEAFQMDLYYKEIVSLEPTYYIIPDTFWDADATIKQYDKWMENYGKYIKNSKCIAVAQGATLEDIKRCYNHIKDADKIAFTFKFSPKMLDSLKSRPSFAWMNRYPSAIDNPAYKNALERAVVLMALELDGVIDKTKPHHLLGAQNLYGLSTLCEKFTWIESIDTSNPIMNGWEGRIYPTDRLDRATQSKPNTLLADIFESTPTAKQYDDIIKNVQLFRRTCEGINSPKFDKNIVLVGTHGTGKSTVAQALNIKYGVPVIESVARISKKLFENLKPYISNAGDDETSEVRQKITSLLSFWDFQRIKDTHIPAIFTRSPIDVVAYSLANNDPTANEQLEKLYNEVSFDGCELCYIPIEFDVVGDGVRPTDIVYQKKVDNEMMKILDKLSKDGKEVHIITGTVDERCRQILDILS